MAVITLRKLNEDPEGVIATFEETQEPVLIVSEGKTVAVLTAVNESILEEVAVSAALKSVQSLSRGGEIASSGESRPPAEALPGEGAQQESPAERHLERDRPQAA